MPCTIPQNLLNGSIAIMVGNLKRYTFFLCVCGFILDISLKLIVQKELHITLNIQNMS